MMTRRHLKKAYSLMEVMMATVIISVVAAFLATSIPASIVTGASVQDISKATDLAQRYMETIKSEVSYQSTYDLLSAGTTPPIPLSSDFTDNGNFTVQTTVTDLETIVVDSNSIPVLKEINVEYIRANDDLSIINISTLVARPEY